MILYPPLVFDANEWFILIAGSLVMLLTLKLPKRLSRVEFWIIWLMNYLLAEIADFTIGFPGIDLYDFNDWPQYEYFDWILYVFLYPPAAYVYLYLYDRWKPAGWKLAGYIVGWALFTTGLEWLATQFHVFTYKGWKLVYSVPTYIFIYWINLCIFRFVRTYQHVPIPEEKDR
ncbi:hypothetical protein [Brevibacillus dissolubilis]|uniref:hypothetical protein n=1 Tax=Brevibacillus dissolubilis TaxID=1844116 RepID=UPI001116438D|nr:hypothetical protein [Brevibacillus dissolubilis]